MKQNRIGYRAEFTNRSQVKKQAIVIKAMAITLGLSSLINIALALWNIL